MMDIIIIFSSVLIGVSVAAFLIYLDRFFASIILPPDIKDRVVINAQRLFIDNYKIYQWLLMQMVQKGLIYVPSKIRLNCEHIWEKSGEKPQSLPYFFAKLQLLMIIVLLLFIMAIVITGNFIFSCFAAIPFVLLVLLIYVELMNYVKRRLNQIDRELPYMMDLLSMMLKGGGNIFVALQALVSVRVDSPLMSEMKAVMGAMRMGKSFSEALRVFCSKIGSDNIKSLVLAIEQGERLGTPLHRILQSQASTIRNKRILQAEEQAHSAGVKVFIPGSLVMLSVMILLLAPLIMRIFKSI